MNNFRRSLHYWRFASGKSPASVRVVLEGAELYSAVARRGLKLLNKLRG
jgi:hypothetical protein